MCVFVIWNNMIPILYAPSVDLTIESLARVHQSVRRAETRVGVARSQVRRVSYWTNAPANGETVLQIDRLSRAWLPMLH